MTAPINRLPVAHGRNEGYAARVNKRTRKPKPGPQSGTLSASETAELLDIALTTLYGLVDRGEIPRIPGREPFEFDTATIVKIAADRADHPRKRASDGTLRGRPRVNPEDERVRQFGRATDAEVERWRRAAPQGNVWPWLRELANKAADKAGV